MCVFIISIIQARQEDAHIFVCNMAGRHSITWRFFGVCFYDSLQFRAGPICLWGEAHKKLKTNTGQI